MHRMLALLSCFMLASPLLECQDDSSQSYFSPDQLDNLLAPVALYPDPLLAQVLVAATFPDDIDAAARFLRANPDPAQIDGESWDVSVKAVAHYPDVISMMADSLDWTTALGQAYAEQPDDVMASVQRLRAQARAAGNLESGPQQEVVDDGGNIEIWPAQADSISVPVYDPGVVYFGSGGAMGSDVETFGPPCVIGVWLNRDFDWRHRRIFYHGWSSGQGWVGRARRYVQLNPVYVDSRFQNVATGRAVAVNIKNYAALDRYSSVHRNVTFSRAGAAPQAPSGAVPAGNKVIQRNFDTSDPRLNAFRGDAQAPMLRAGSKVIPQPQVRESQQPALPPQPSTPGYRLPEVNRPAPQPTAQEPQRPHNEAFGANPGPFAPQQASQRGQASRSEMAQPAPRMSSPAPSRAPGPRDTGRR